MVKSNSKVEIARITKGLQEAVREHFLTAEDESTLTINNIRTRSEEVLKLKSGFFKDDEFWKTESKKVIREEVDNQNNEAEEGTKERESPLPVSSIQNDVEDGHVSDTSKLKEGEEDPVEQTEEAPRKIARGNRGSEAVKRKPTAAKKQRRDVEPDEDGTPQKKKPRTKSGITKRTPVKSVKETVPEEPESDVEDTNKESSATSGVEAPIEIENEDDAAAAPVQPITDASESEMSEVLDLTPKKKKASRSGSVAVPKSKPKSKASSEAATEKRSTKKKEGPELSADDEKIKSLQGWLLKCGIRKVWGKELKKFPTTDEKIQHLRNLLEEVGMSGRYSAEKAKKIKEERELAAEVEAVQAGASEWGLEGSDKPMTRSSRNAQQPAPTTNRRLVRAELAFLDDQSEGSDD